MNSADQRKLVRAIVRRVHPDLFQASPFERQCNSDSLKVLNNYLDEVASGAPPTPSRLEFYVKENGGLKRVEAFLSGNSGLVPLFHAFGLVTDDELNSFDPQTMVTNTNILAWLRDIVQEALRTAEQHEALKWHIRRYRATVEQKYMLASVQVGQEYAVNITEQERQLESLKVLDSSLSQLASEEGTDFEGLSIQLYHPANCPVESYTYVQPDGSFNIKTKQMNSYVADDGSLHLVADRASVKSQLKTLDLSRAKMLTKVTLFWLRRVRELTPIMAELLGVRSVWCDTKTEQNSQKFVVWAGYILERREQIQEILRGRNFQFSLIVHSDSQGPMINFHPASPVLNVRSDCPPSQLLEFMISDTGSAASEAASEVHMSREQEEALLDKVRAEFNAKCVIKICMNDKVLEGAKRLLENAELIKQVVDLKGACIALDDCYEVWDSGFISIPYNFKINELGQMVRLLQSGGKVPSQSSNSNAQRTAVVSAFVIKGACTAPLLYVPRVDCFKLPKNLTPRHIGRPIVPRTATPGLLPKPQRQGCIFRTGVL